VCDIELQAGETIQQVLLGDSKRWFAIPSSHGTKNTVTPHVGIKPTEKGIVSNLVVYTDRRTYQFELIEGGKGERIGFLYPDEEQKVMRVEVKPQAIENESYTISGTAPWKPVRVVDDGTRTLITLPESVRVTEMPVLFDVSNGNESLVNYSVRWPVLTVGRILTRGRLVIGTGWKRQQVEIRQTR
jgi:type IV secretion system protein VirB9